MVPEFASLNKHPNIRQNKYLLNLKVLEKQTAEPIKFEL
jgi:hypothetical protein